MKGLNRKVTGHLAALLSAIVLLSVTAGCSTQPGSAASSAGGYVVVQFCIAKTGAVYNARVMESSPPGQFDDTALRIVRQWHFRPVMFVGVPTNYCGVREKLSFDASGQLEQRSNLGEETTTDQGG